MNNSDMKLWANVMMRASNNFDIASGYSSKNQSPAEFYAEPDTYMCAIGYAAVLGIGEPEQYTVNDSAHIRDGLISGGWNDYGLNLFSVQSVGDYRDEGNRLGYWIASQHWEKVDNTSYGAGQRILFALENGVPSWQEIGDMMLGKCELPYTDIAIENKSKPKIDVSKWFDVDKMVIEYPDLVSA